MNENEKTENHENHAEMTVGEILRNARTTGRRKREIPTVSKQLCIREEFLQALEDGNYNVIPETVYILGFARNYAMELGLDPDEIVSKLKREIGLVADECPDDDKSKADDDDDNNATDGDAWYKRAFDTSVKFIRRNWIWFVSGLGVLIIAACVLTFFMLQGPDEVAPTVPAGAIEQPIDTGEPKYNVEVRERFGLDNVDTADVILQATQESWVQVKDARGNEVLGRSLVRGDIYYVPAGDGYTATFGNAGGIDVWVNGELAPKQGGDHERVSGISLSPDDLI